MIKAILKHTSIFILKFCVIGILILLAFVLVSCLVNGVESMADIYATGHTDDWREGYLRGQIDAQKGYYIIDTVTTKEVVTTKPYPKD